MNRPRLGHPVVTAAGKTTSLAIVLHESSQVTVQTALTAQDMNDALAAGDAAHLSSLITDFVHHQNHWWIAYASGWLRVDDEDLSQLLTVQHQRFSASG
jgi:hypothetical protein